MARPAIDLDRPETWTDAQAVAARYVWELFAREKQLPPPTDWLTWLVLAGRGWGKTRVGAQYVIARAEANPRARIALVGTTAADVRDVMIEGESGILACSAPWFRPHYESSKRRLTWPNGAIATGYSSEKPRQLRGPQHTDAWADELAAWKYPEDTWTNLQLGLRIGAHPRAVGTTTPRPIPLIRQLLGDDGTSLTHGTTYENRPNLAPTFVKQVLKRYEGTRLGRQELGAEILDDTPGALWKRQQIEDVRVRTHPALVRIVVAVDPAVTSEEDSAETGIIVAGVGEDGHGYVLDDVSGIYSPLEWGKAVDLAFHVQKADRVVAEVNNGGDLVEANLRVANAAIPYTGVHAARGKRTRAEPVAALYEQGRVHHVGALPQLEDQMCTWDPMGDASPDRVDALVWALTELLVDGSVDLGARAVRIRSRRR